MASGKYAKKRTPLYIKLMQRLNHIPVSKKAEYLVIFFAVILSLAILFTVWWINNF